MARSNRKKFRDKARNRIRKYKEAMIDLSWKGSKDPEEFDDIEETARVQEKKIMKFIMNLYDSKAIVEEFDGVVQ